MWEEGPTHSTPPSHEPKKPTAKWLYQASRPQSHFTKYSLIPLWTSGGYPPRITGSNDASILESGLPSIYGHLTFQTAQQVLKLWKMLSEYPLKCQGGLYANSKSLGWS